MISHITFVFYQSSYLSTVNITLAYVILFISKQDNDYTFEPPFIQITNQYGQTRTPNTPLACIVKRFLATIAAF